MPVCIRFLSFANENALINTMYKGVYGSVVLIAKMRHNLNAHHSPLLKYTEVYAHNGTTQPSQRSDSAPFAHIERHPSYTNEKVKEHNGVYVYMTFSSKCVIIKGRTHIHTGTVA